MCAVVIKPYYVCYNKKVLKSTAIAFNYSNSFEDCSYVMFLSVLFIEIMKYIAFLSYEVS